MAFRLYASNAGDYVLVPECMQASQAATNRFGPLTFLGCAEPMALSQSELVDVWAQIDADSFAVVDEGLARALWRSLPRSWRQSYIIECNGGSPLSMCNVGITSPSSPSAASMLATSCASPHAR